MNRITDDRHAVECVIFCRVHPKIVRSTHNTHFICQHILYAGKINEKVALLKTGKKSIRFSYHASYEWNIAEQYFGRIRIIALYMHISGALWPTHRTKFIQFRCGNLQQFGMKLKSKSNVFSCFLRIPCASWIILASKFEAKNWKKKQYGIGIPAKWSYQNIIYKIPIAIIKCFITLLSDKRWLRLQKNVSQCFLWHILLVGCDNESAPAAKHVRNLIKI